MTSAMLRVRQLGPADLAVCLDLADDRGWGRDERMWKLLLHAGQGFGLEAPEGGLAASAVLTAVSNNLATVSMMLVAPRFERRGLGTRLMHHVLTQAGDCSVLLYATKVGRRLYESLGFVPDGAIQSYQGTIAAPAAPMSRPATDGDVMAIHELDTMAYGTERREPIGKLRATAGYVRVVEAGGRVTGYALGTTFENEMIIGPVVTANLEQATALIADIAALAHNPVRIWCDTAESELAEWLRTGGLTFNDPLPRMVRGSRVAPGEDVRRFATAGPALG